MNIRKRYILITVAILFAAMMLYPPYYFLKEEFFRNVRHEYDWLINSGYGRVEVELLLAQFIAVGVIGRIAYILCADKKS